MNGENGKLPGGIQSEDSLQAGEAPTAPACDQRRAKVVAEGPISATEDYSIFYVKMGLVLILFVDSEARQTKQQIDTVVTEKNNFTVG